MISYESKIEYELFICFFVKAAVRYINRYIEKRFLEEKVLDLKC